MKKGGLKKWCALALCFSMLGACAACGKGAENSEESYGDLQEYGFALLSNFDEPVYLLPDEVLRYLQSDGSELVTDYLPMGSHRCDQGKPVLFEYSVRDMRSVEASQVEVSLDADFATIVGKANFQRRDATASVYNLLPNTSYHFRITVVREDGVKLRYTGEFQTAQSLRFMSLDGASNVRDIGGWATEGGKIIQYGLLYRGGEIDGGKNTGHPDFCLTEKGIEQLRGLGIKTDLDLRSESVKVGEYSILGSDVSRSFYDAAQYESIMNPSNAERTRRIFSDLAKPDAYPIYLHCTHGVDRAGSTTLILEALLGVAEADLVRDYELSAFFHSYAHVNRNTENGGNILKLIEKLKEYEGETLADKTAAFLLSIGVTQAEIDSIRNILLG